MILKFGLLFLLIFICVIKCDMENLRKFNYFVEPVNLNYEEMEKFEEALSVIRPNKMCNFTGIHLEYAWFLQGHVNIIKVFNIFSPTLFAVFFFAERGICHFADLIMRSRFCGCDICVL